MSEMTVEVAAKLRQPFDPKEIGKLPRVWCRQCRESPTKHCQQHSKARCQICGNSMTEAHLHLDYVGHAEITDRLLEVDRSWVWEPVAFTGDGVPYLDAFGGLWIRLTVAGVSRLGYGHADGKKGPDAVKEAIGDALRNAAMRFGVGLDLWGAKFVGEQPQQQDERETEAAASEAQSGRFDELAKRLAAAETDAMARVVWEAIVAAYKADEITTQQANELRTDLEQRKATFASAS